MALEFVIIACQNKSLMSFHQNKFAQEGKGVINIVCLQLESAVCLHFSAENYYGTIQT